MGYRTDVGENRAGFHNMTQHIRYKLHPNLSLHSSPSLVFQLLGSNTSTFDKMSLVSKSSFDYTIASACREVFTAQTKKEWLGFYRQWVKKPIWGLEEQTALANFTVQKIMLLAASRKIWGWRQGSECTSRRKSRGTAWSGEKSWKWQYLSLQDAFSPSLLSLSLALPIKLNLSTCHLKHYTHWLLFTVLPLLAIYFL